MAIVGSSNMTSSVPTGISTLRKSSLTVSPLAKPAARDRHAQAVANRRDAHDQLRNCDTIDRLDTMLPSVGEQRSRVQALSAWRRWAQGHRLPDGALHTACAVLAHQPGVEQHLATALRTDLGTPIEPRPHHGGRVDVAVAKIAQRDFGIEL